MNKRVMLSVASALFAFAGAAADAEAVVYCKAAGVPRGCVVRPPAGAAGVGVRPGIGAGAAGVGVRPGVGVGRPGRGVNTGGPVNRAGLR